MKVPCRHAYAKPATVARARVGEMGKGYYDKASLWERCCSRNSMVYGTQVQGVREVQGEQGADSDGQAGVQSQWADAAGFVRTVKEVLRSRDCRLDSQVSGLRTEPVAWLAVVGEAVVVTPEYGSIPHGWWFAVLEQG